MSAETIQGILIPFLGTTLGAACVLFMKDRLNPLLQRALTGFAAGAMIYIVVEELIHEMSAGRHSDLGTVFFAFGSAVMLALDVALG